MCIMFMLSPGFYELSDGGSCSLSNSCTSVYSECLSSSQTSLLLLPLNPANSQINPPSQVDVCRRRSADEGTTHPNPPRATGFHLGSSRIRASTTGSDQARPRPVSTGNYFTDPRLRNYCYSNKNNNTNRKCGISFYVFVVKCRFTDHGRYNVQINARVKLQRVQCLCLIEKNC